MSVRSTIWSALILIAVLSIGGAALLSHSTGREVLEQAALEGWLPFGSPAKCSLKPFSRLLWWRRALQHALCASVSQSGESNPQGRSARCSRTSSSATGTPMSWLSTETGWSCRTLRFMMLLGGGLIGRPLIVSSSRTLTERPGLAPPREPFIVDYERRDDWKRPAECIVVFPFATNTGDGGYILVLISAESLTELTGAAGAGSTQE